MSIYFSLFASLTFLGSSQVPPEDQCQAVDANEPPQCPKTIGPPCPPCIINTEPDYSNGDLLQFTNSELNQITQRMNENINYWYTEMPPDNIYPDNDPTSFYNGASGRAFLFIRLYHYTKNDSYSEMAKEYIEAALKYTTEKSLPGYSSFMFGNTGVYTIAAVVYDVLGDTSTSQTYVNKLVASFGDVYDSIQSNLTVSTLYNYNLEDGSLITGLGGLLYCGMFINKYFDDNTIISASQINLITSKIVSIGMTTAQQYGYSTLLLYNMPFGNEQCVVPGAAEGIGGVIHILLQTYNEGYVPDLFDNYYINIRDTLNFVMDNALPDGNIPTYYTGNLLADCANVYGNDSDARVQWCHGAPGFIGTFSQAGLLFASINETDSTNYLTAALSVAEVTWERGLLIKGLMQCHGIGGNSYQILHIFRNFQYLPKNTPDINGKSIEYYMNQSVYRSQEFIRFTLVQENIDALRTQYSTSDYSVWAGSYGIPMLYIESMQNGWDNGNSNICMSGWDLCFW